MFERNQAVIYRGPFKEILDDDNHRMERDGATQFAIKPTIFTESAVSRFVRARRSDWSMYRWPKQSRSIVRVPLCGTRRKPKDRITA